MKENQKTAGAGAAAGDAAMGDAMDDVKAGAGADSAPPPRQPQGAPRQLSAAARRALAEAEARRTEIDARQKQAAKEIDGRGGLDPVRYGDWEVKGMTSDF